MFVFQNVTILKHGIVFVAFNSEVVFAAFNIPQTQPLKVHFECSSKRVNYPQEIPSNSMKYYGLV